MAVLTERQIQAINRFPDQNPHPVMRFNPDGELTYANAASAPVLAAMGNIGVGDHLPPEMLERLLHAAREDSAAAVEVVHEHRTYALLPVFVEDLSFVNLYGTDVTARKLIDRFPGDNPHPVMRVTPEGQLIYANASSGPIVEALDLALGRQLPTDLLARLQTSWADPSAGPVEVAAGSHTYELRPIELADFGFVNVYGTDVTARKALDRFPGQNPHPVMRMAPDGTLLYANRASVTIVAGLGLQTGRPLPAELVEQLRAALADESISAIEVNVGELMYELWPVDVPEFGFINVYGTDVTAAHRVQELNRENERLLLNILPPAIADRLRGGERIIADRFEDVTLLFADIVGFTTLSSALEPNEVVEMLNSIFGMTDRLTDEFGLEKIKTIGDAYLVAGGMSEQAPDHTERVARLALRMVDELARMAELSGRPVHCRFGIHTGPAVAGVIGHKKYIYDVWGDTVNMASRMESHGSPGRIHVSHAVYERLADKFRFESRGLVDIKGKGPLPTYFLLGAIDHAEGAE